MPTRADPLDAGDGALTHWEGEPVSVWRTVWDVPRLEAYSSLTSTNDRAKTWAAGEAAPFSLVLAEAQSSGRGRGGRRWVSAPGDGLLMSLLLAQEPVAARPSVPLLAGLAVCRAIEVVLPELSPEVKWPNDVLLGGRKVCGILCEGAVGEPLVVGIGLNVRGSRDTFPAEVRGSAGSLESEAGRSVSRSRIAGAVVRQLRALLDPPPLRLQGEVGEDLSSRDALRGRRVQVVPGPTGTARGIDEAGLLIVETDSGESHHVLAGSVHVAGNGGGGREDELPADVQS